jgi:SM-20-related protein
VYYFFSEPKAFNGGALRLYAIGGNSQQSFIDIEPERNSLLVFPSWAPHEVMPVHCPSGRFVDSRFAINCWLYRKKSGAEIRPREAAKHGIL